MYIEECNMINSHWYVCISVHKHTTSGLLKHAGNICHGLCHKRKLNKSLKVKVKTIEHLELTENKSSLLGPTLKVSDSVGLGELRNY